MYKYESKKGGYFIIREAEMGDLEHIIFINRVSLPENYTPEFFKEHLDKWKHSFLVGMYEDKIVGYVMCRVEWGWSNFSPKFTRKGHVISLAVLPEYRRLGIGEKLMVHALDALKTRYSANEVYLEVRVSNMPAIKLYEKLGFKIIRVVPMYYSDGEDAYIMARKL